MKCTIPEISWHNREPVLSVDVHPVVSDCLYKLATAGGDCHIVLWQMEILDNGAVKQEMLSELTKHQRTVNVVRWCPQGKRLASADDDANIIIWQQKTDSVPLLDKDSIGNEVWICYKVLRGHKEDVYDLCWSPDGNKLLSGSIDNTSIVWDVTTGKYESILPDHKGFVQGVAWDPKGTYLATSSTDRTLRIFDSSGKQVKARVCKGLLPVSENHHLYEKDVKYFHDDTFKSFFRRLHFSPDGSLLLVPSGKIETDECKKPLYATYVFAVESWTQPVGMFPNPRQCSTVVRCCPLLFELREDGPEPVISLPYRMVMAIGTDRDIVLYDTQQMAPFARFRDVHYTRLTDLTWSSDGRLLVAASTDGFCSLVTFDPEELGLVYYAREESDGEAEDAPIDTKDQPCEAGVSVEEQDKKHITSDVSTAASKKRSTFLEAWALNATHTPKKRKLDVKADDGVDTVEKPMDIIDISEDEIVDITEDSSSQDIKNIEKEQSGQTADDDDSKVKIRTIIPTSVKISNETASSKSTASTATVTKSTVHGSEKEEARKRITPILVSTSGSNSTSSAVVTADTSRKKRITPIPVSSNNQIISDSTATLPTVVTTEATSSGDGRIVKKRITPIPVDSKDQTNNDGPSGENKIVKKRITPILLTPKKRITPTSIDKCDSEQRRFKFKDTIAKPIAVRRKPREPSEQNTSNQCQLAEDVIVKSSDTIIPEDTSGKCSTDIVSSSSTVGAETNTPSTSSTSQTVDANEKSVDCSAPEESKMKDSTNPEVVGCSSIVSGSSSVSSKPQPLRSQSEEDVKQSASTTVAKSGGKPKQKRKDKQPTPKNNSLLKYLKPSPKQETIKTTTKTSAKANLFGKPNNDDDDSECIIIEDEARDAWKCDKVNNTPVTDNSSRVKHVDKDEHSHSIQMEDECTAEDFRLQIEDSTQGTCDKSNTRSDEPAKIQKSEVVSSQNGDEPSGNVKQQQSGRDDSKHEQLLETSCSNSEEKHKKHDKEFIEESKCSDSIEIKPGSDNTSTSTATATVQSSSSSRGTVEELVKSLDAVIKPVKHHRVPLITLSSPKQKKKLN